MSRTIRNFNKSTKNHPNFKTVVNVMDYAIDNNESDHHTFIANVKLIHDRKGRPCIVISESGLEFDKDVANAKIQKQTRQKNL